jgi:hypothetical protein
MIEYDRAVVPPAPIVEVEVANPYSGKSRKVLGKIDSGAAISTIPVALLNELDLERAGSIGVRGFNQERARKMKTYRVNLSFENCKFELVEVILTPNPYVLVGRDILNQLKIILDGKNLQFQIIE